MRISCKAYKNNAPCNGYLNTEQPLDPNLCKLYNNLGQPLNPVENSYLDNGVLFTQNHDCGGLAIYPIGSNKIINKVSLINGKLQLSLSGLKQDQSNNNVIKYNAMDTNLTSDGSTITHKPSTIFNNQEYSKILVNSNFTFPNSHLLNKTGLAKLIDHSPMREDETFEIYPNFNVYLTPTGRKDKFVINILRSNTI